MKGKPNDKAEPRAGERERSRQETNLLSVFIEDTLAGEDVSRDTNEEYLEDGLQHHNHRISKSIEQGASARPLTSKVVLRSGPIGVPLFRSAIHSTEEDLRGVDPKLWKREGRGRQREGGAGGTGDGRKCTRGRARMRRACVIVKVEVASIPSQLSSQIHCPDTPRSPAAPVPSPAIHCTFQRLRSTRIHIWCISRPRRGARPGR